ncbi:MAG: tetratricopeptide repeat protein [Heliobacteriaceae bacterium]|nr:tetratricopeptide repeat protein [Heliobacteriaceae bacterium]
MKRIEKAFEYYKQGNWQKAIDVFSSVLETGPDSAEIHNNMGICYRQLGDLEQAEKHYLRARELDPKIPQVYINLADIYYVIKDFDSGIQLLSQGVYEMPENPVLRHYLARFYMEDAKFDLAVDELEKILENQPENYDAYYDLGRVHFELGNYHLAVENFENVIEYKANEYIHYFLGQAYEANNETDKAISNYLKAIAFDNGFKPAYKKLGILFLAREDYEDAVEYFEDYMKMDVPDADKIKELVERIKMKTGNTLSLRERVRTLGETAS